MKNTKKWENGMGDCMFRPKEHKAHKDPDFIHFLSGARQRRRRRKKQVKNPPTLCNEL